MGLPCMVCACTRRQQGACHMSRDCLCLWVLTAALAVSPGRPAAADDAPANPTAAATKGATDPPEPSAAPVKYSLAYRFRPGEVVHYDVAHESEIKTHVK